MRRTTVYLPGQLKETLELHEVLTLDERHFRVRTANGRALRLLPADA
jgi:hypothetical protein